MEREHPQPALFVVAAVGCLLLVVGALGAWKTANVGSVSVSRSGVQGGSDGPILIVFAVLAGAMVLCYALVPRLPLWAAIIALIVGVLALVTSIADTIDIADRAYLSPGWGIYVDIVGAVALAGAAGGLTAQAVQRGRRRPALTPAAGMAGAPGPTPAGWYADPWRQARMRYWDGSSWTGHTAD